MESQITTKMNQKCSLQARLYATKDMQNINNLMIFLVVLQQSHSATQCYSQEEFEIYCHTDDAWPHKFEYALHV